MNKSKTESGFFQRIEVENYMERASYDYTMQAQNQSYNNPKMVIEVKDSMINTFNVEDILEVAGVLKTEISARAEEARRIKNIGFFDTYLDVNSARKIDKMLSLNTTLKFGDTSVERLLHSILTSEIGLYILVKSFCPEVQGQDYVKTLILFSLIKGSPPHKVFINEPEKVPDHHVFNENLNLLLLGEKGLFKSYILKYLSELDTNCKFRLEILS